MADSVSGEDPLPSLQSDTFFTFSLHSHLMETHTHKESVCVGGKGKGGGDTYLLFLMKTLILLDPGLIL